MLDSLFSHLHQIALICVFTAYIASAITDFISLRVSFAVFVAYIAVIADICANLTLYEACLRFIVALVFFCVLAIMAKIGVSGGGDAIYIPILILAFPMPFPIFVVLLGCVLTLLYAMAQSVSIGRSVSAREYPLIPGMACALVILYAAAKICGVPL